MVISLEVLMSFAWVTRWSLVIELTEYVDSGGIRADTSLAGTSAGSVAVSQCRIRVSPIHCQQLRAKGQEISCES